MKKTSKAFSLIELSIVVLVIGILIAGVIQGSKLYDKFKISTARTLTQSSSVNGIKDLVLWFDASREGILTNSNNSKNVEDGDFIQTWQEVNPLQQEQLVFSAPAAENRPIYKSKALNGLPALYFDGSDDYMTIPSHPRHDFINDMTIFLVVQVSGSSFGKTIICKNRGTTFETNSDLGNPPYEIAITNSNNILFFSFLVRNANVNNNDSSISKLQNLKPNIISAVYDSSKSKNYLFLNGGTPSSKINTGLERLNFVNSQLVLGRQKLGSLFDGRNFNGNISEVINLQQKFKR